MRVTCLNVGALFLVAMHVLFVEVRLADGIFRAALVGALSCTLFCPSLRCVTGTTAVDCARYAFYMSAAC